MQNLFKNKSFLWSMLGVVVLVVGIVVALQLIPQEQDTRREAAVPGGVAKMVVSPATISVGVNETKSAKVSFSTGGKKINTVAVVMTSGANPGFTVENLAQSSQLPDGWSCPLKEATTANQKITIKFRCSFDSPGGYTAANAQQQIDLFTFIVKGTTAGSATLTFDTLETAISEVDSGVPDTATDVLDIPNNLAITITAATTPPAEKKITLATPTLTCTAAEFSANATVTEGTTKKSGVVLTFKYNGTQKNATSDAQGVATASFTKGATNMTITAEAAGYTTGSTAVTLPTCETPPPDDGDSTDTDKRLLMSYEGLSCTNTTFTVTAEAKEDDQLWQDVLVTFSYDGQQKTATTNSSGKASVSFPSSATDTSVEATATDFDKGSIEVKRPTDCASTSTTGASCNSACTASRDCISGLTCVSGFCRDSRCSSDASCGCSDVDVAAEQGTTELPESGFDQTSTMAILGIIFLLGGGQLLWSYWQRPESNSQE